MLTDIIIENWKSSAKGYATKISELFDMGYPAWTVKTTYKYGVAIPFSGVHQVNETFAGAKLYSDTISLKGESVDALLLVTDLDEIKSPFAALCAELISPGKDGEQRRSIESDPVLWWTEWKELLGNRNVDERIYDVLGELCAVYYLSTHGESPIWNGPNHSTYDIDCEDDYYEVKSTTSRKKKHITLSNQFQLDPPDGKKLYLLFCQFELSQKGLYIDDMVEKLVTQGYSRASLEESLSRAGLERGKSSRRRCYILHAMTKYVVDDEFPAIRKKSFIGGDLPKGVESITYTVSLDGIEGTVLEQSNEEEIQNN